MMRCQFRASLGLSSPLYEFNDTSDPYDIQKTLSMIIWELAHGIYPVTSLGPLHPNAWLNTVYDHVHFFRHRLLLLWSLGQPARDRDWAALIDLGRNCLSSGRAELQSEIAINSRSRRQSRNSSARTEVLVLLSLLSLVAGGLSGPSVSSPKPGDHSLRRREVETISGDNQVVGRQPCFWGGGEVGCKKLCVPAPSYKLRLLEMFVQCLARENWMLTVFAVDDQPPSSAGSTQASRHRPGSHYSAVPVLLPSFFLASNMILFVQRISISLYFQRSSLQTYPV